MQACGNHSQLLGWGSGCDCAAPAMSPMPPVALGTLRFNIYVPVVAIALRCFR